MKNIKIKKSLFSLFVIVGLLALNIYPVFAFSIPSPSKVASDLEKRYHINLGSVQSQGESFNTGDDKKPGVEVSLSFDPTDPKLGEKVSATAAPLNFYNDDPKHLYYTWYLKHHYADGVHSVYDNTLGRNISCDGYGNCDLNGEDGIDIEDYKIAAARIIADGSFDWNVALGQASSNCTGSTQPSYCAQSNQYLSATDDQDGYKSVSGGEDKRGMPRHCYLHDFESGTDYELVNGVAESSNYCVNGGTPICALTQENLTGDIVNGLASEFVCTRTDDEPSCSIQNSTTGDFSCPSPDEIPMCVKEDNIVDDIIIRKFDYTTVPPTAISPYVSDECETIDTDCVVWPKATATSTCAAYPNSPFDESSCITGSNGHTISDISFICDDPDKRHLFPYPPSGSRRDSGDESFDLDEEKFWHTNPNSASSINNGNKDEANVIGLGQMSFSWNYEPGDLVGVAVEGVSTTTTKYDDSSMMLVWALPKNKCDIENTGTYVTNIKGYNVKIPVTDTDINECLEDNLVDPRGDQNSLTVSLSYSPESPVNDTSVDNVGDELIVSASVPNGKNKNYLNYQWEVYAGSSINPINGWGGPISKSDLKVDQTSGIGFSTFKFKLNFPTSIWGVPEPATKLFRVRVTVTEKSDSTTTNSGSADVIIPISSTSNKIHVYSTSAESDLSVNLLTNDERCSRDMENVVCPVVKNEIVGLQVDSASNTLSNFLWTVDGQPLAPINPSCASGDCVSSTGAATDMVFFPVLKEKGEQYSINLTADTSSGSRLNLTKTFKVEDPKVIIAIDPSSNDTCKAEYLGMYVDLDGVEWPDYSDTSFVAVTGTITLKPELNMPFIQNAQWLIDGVEATSFGATVQADGTLSFTADKAPGETYNITYSGIYAQDMNIKKVLNSSFDVQLNEFFEKPIGAAVEITMTETFADATAQAPTVRKILASIATDIPAYIIFLFRIVLTTFLILFISWIFSALFPQTNED
ncbi:MAG: hypothetical protein WCX17_04360 [Parcubacteria group bacterium]|jgi:hypothetical protein